MEDFVAGGNNADLKRFKRFDINYREIFTSDCLHATDFLFISKSWNYAGSDGVCSG